MAQPIKTYFNYQLPVPDIMDDEAVLAYSTAYAVWRLDREEERAWDRIQLVENQADHQAVIARATELAS